MATNSFSHLINGEISNARRVRHSGRQYLSSIDRTSFGLPGRGPISSGGVSGAAGVAGSIGSSTVMAAANVASNAGGVLGGVAGVATMVGAGVASAAFLAACAGPQVAITGAVIGLVMLAKGSYSNRESAHKSLSKYVWNLVDTEPPATPPINADLLHDAADAALTLMDDGKNQIKLIHSKLADASQKVTDFNIKVISAHNAYIKASEDLNRTWHRYVNQYNAAAAVKEKKAQALQTLWADAVKPGGAIFEYVRRCAHMGNYLQAPLIISLAMKEKYSPGSVTAADFQRDYFANTRLRTDTQSLFSLLEYAEANFRSI